MSFNEGDDIVPVIIGQPLDLAVLIGTKIFRAFFLGRCLGNRVESDLERTLNF